MHESNIPVTASGSDFQLAQEDGAEFDNLHLPDEISTFTLPVMPEPDLVQNLDRGMQTLSELDKVLQHQAKVRDIKPEFIDITHLDGENRALVDQVLGEGGVSMVFQGSHTSARIQASAMAGIWRIRYFNQQGEATSDSIEVAHVPRLCRRHVFSHASHRVDTQIQSIPDGVVNAPSLLAEINDKVAEYRPGRESHVINLTLLSQTEQDLTFLNERLGEGALSIRARGDGNCRISSTAVQNVWWVHYFNAQDKNILNTLEIGDVPDAAAAANKDIRNSALRLNEIMEAYR